MGVGIVVVCFSPAFVAAGVGLVMKARRGEGFGSAAALVRYCLILR